MASTKKSTWYFRLTSPNFSTSVTTPVRDFVIGDENSFYVFSCFTPQEELYILGSYYLHPVRFPVEVPEDQTVLRSQPLYFHSPHYTKYYFILGEKS